MKNAPKRLVLDAGPLIAFFYAKDDHHEECKRGFEQLDRGKVRLLVSIPILFEVYKWLLYTTNFKIAQTDLKIMMEAFDFVALSSADFLEVYALTQVLPFWNGSLEDATVIWLSQKYQCPVWTLNYRDFGSFSSLEFWNPEPR